MAGKVWLESIEPLLAPVLKDPNRVIEWKSCGPLVLQQ